MPGVRLILALHNHQPVGNFDGVFEDGGAGLDDLVPGVVGLFGEAEAVGSDDGSVLQDDVVAELAVLADDGVGVGEEVVSGADVGVEDDVGEEGGVVAYRDVLADDCVGSDVGVYADLRSRPIRRREGVDLGDTVRIGIETLV